MKPRVALAGLGIVVVAGSWACRGPRPVGAEEVQPRPLRRAAALDSAPSAPLPAPRRPADRGAQQAPAAVEEAPARGGVRRRGEDSAAAGRGEAAAGGSEPLTLGALARVNGRDITTEEYGNYLLASIGKSRLGEYIDRLLLEREAARLGVRVLPEDVEALLREEIDQEVQSLYQGHRERLEAELERAHLTLADYEAKRRQTLYMRLLTEAVVLKKRRVTEADLREEFERLYGSGGVEHVIQHILVAQGPLPGGQTRSLTEARGRAASVLKELEDGSDFVAAVREYSDDALTRRNEGRLPHYRSSLFGAEFHEGVEALTPAQPLSGVLASPRGYHIVKLIEKRSVRFEDVEENLREAVAGKAPSREEKQELVRDLRQAATIERF